MLFSSLCATAPIAAVLVLMLGRRLGAGWAGLAGWLVAVAVAVIGFGAGPYLLFVAQAKALLLAAYVLYIIIMALLFFHTMNEAGAIQVIGAQLIGLTADRGLQALLLAWTFGSFLQGVSGYGVPTAIVAPLLVGLGFAAAPAVVMASLGHAWAVSFGSLGASFEALVAVSGRSPAELAPMATLFLGLACFGCGAAVLWVVDGLRAIRQGLGRLLAVGLVMSGVQVTLAVAGLYPFAAVGAGLAGIVVMVALVSWQNRALAVSAGATPSGGLSLGQALLPYGLLVVLMASAELIPPVNRLLNALIIQADFRPVQTAQGYLTPAETGRTLSVFGHPGALLGYATLLVYGFFRWRGRLKPGAAGRIARRVQRSSLVPALSITAMVAMAVTMEHAGMTRALAEGLAALVGPLYPAVSPLIGALGAFMTGSNTNSNVIFGALQQDTADLLGLWPALILAAQTTGGAIGGAFAPAKVIVGCSTVGLAGQEAGVLKHTISIGLVLLAVIGLVTLGLAWP